jgi:hypothetical protein
MDQQTPSIIVNGGTVNITISNDKMAAELLMKKQDAETRMQREAVEVAKNVINTVSDLSKKFVESKVKEQQTKTKKK